MKKALLKSIFFVVAVFATGQTWALANNMGPLGLGAASLGAGGAGVATAEASEAMFWNPAALPSQGWDLGLNLGSGGFEGSLNQALSVVGDLGQGLHAGLLVGNLGFQQAEGARESQVAGAMAVGAGRWLSLGTVQRLHQAEPGGLRGWSMDAGALAGVPLGGGWALRLGAAAADLASSLAWANGLEEVQPMVLRLGLALEARPGTWLALQQDHLDRQSGQGGGQWRAGAQAAFFGQHLMLRAGATQASAGELYYSAGLGAKLDFAGQGLSLDYALLMPGVGGEAASLRHVMALRWQVKAGREAPAAGISNLIKDPSSGKVRHARIALAEGPKDTQAWQLDLKDREGRVVRTFKGRGPLPPSVAWDGKSDAGDLADADGLSYDLRTTSASGRTARHRSLLAPAAQALGSVDQDLADMEDGSFGLRSGAAAAAAVRSKPRLRSGDDLQVQGADFDLRGLQGADDGEWSVRIRDESGRTVKEIRGRGRIPATVRWEGQDDLGRPVDVGLGATYEIRLTDASGQERVTEDDLVRGETLDRLPAAAAASTASTVPDDREVPATGGLPASGCRMDGGKVICTFHFAPGSDVLPLQSKSVIEEIQFLAAGRNGLKLVVDGHAAPAEGAQVLALSQARADAVLKRLVEGRSLNYQAVVATGRGSSRPATGRDDPRSQARNRRAVVMIDLDDR